jgi:(E)-4-hydroxy-3-methylbut-2-enyl-diphosphate synthase
MGRIANGKSGLPRRRTKTIHLGGLGLGSEHPVRVQSMTNTDTRDVDSTLAQVDRLIAAGCEIVRLAVPDEQAARSLARIKAARPLVPLIADIHFDHRLALLAIEAGIDGLRINPGNIGSKQAVDRVADAARSHAVPIRIGANSGSVDRDLLHRYGGPKPEALVESALRHVRLLESRGHADIKISLKSSSVLPTLEAYRELAAHVDYPFHIGITEAGTPIRGSVKSGVGLGLLLHEGLGDTLRVSLTGDPVDEVLVAWEILRSLELRQRGPNIVSCPTCGRTEIDLLGLASDVEEYLRPVTHVFTVAVMGCPVNGPGEAKEADIGIAGGKDCGLIFKKGEIVRKVRGSAHLFAEFKRDLAIFLSELDKQGSEATPCE